MKLQIAVDGNTYVVDVEILQQDEPPSYPVYVPPPAPTTLHAVHLTKADATHERAEPGVFRSPLAGLVTEVLVKPGEQVEQDALLMIIEAMKMETNITAEAAGKVKAVKVATGDAVKLNQVLLEFE